MKNKDDVKQDSSAYQKINGKLVICNRLSLLFLIFGSFSILFSAITYLFSDYIIKNQIHKYVYLAPDSKAFKFWTDPPANIIREYYLFDVKNPKEVQKGTEKPYLVQRGPYTYSEKWEKKNVNFLGVELVSFSPVVTLYFERSLSAGDESDLITFLNIPAVGMFETASSGRFDIDISTVNEISSMFGTELFLVKSVGELISGYDDTLLSMGKMFLPSVIRDDKFSLMNGKNGTIWQNLTIMTGINNVSDVAKIVSWNGLSKLDFWDNDSANAINGTDGTFYPPFRTKDQILRAFNADMCRSYTLEYLRDNVVHGIKTYDFHFPKNIFSNSTINPDNNGFCKNDCLGNGVLNISKCYGGISGFISQPHFLNGDYKFVNSCIGLNPDENKHDSILHFEPTSGVPIAGNIRLQINFYLAQNKKFDLVKNVKPVLMPVFWFDEKLELKNETRSQLSAVALIVNVSFITTILPIVLGFLFLLTSTIITINNMVQSNLRMYLTYTFTEEKNILL